MLSKSLAVLVALVLVDSVVCRDIDIEAYRQKTIECMNRHRQQHHVGPLKATTDLTNMAQKWAQHIVDTGKFEHQGNVGENLFGYWSSADKPPAMDAACENWYSEEPKYNYQVGYTEGAGHFSAMVWKSTTEVGVGIANANGNYFVVADFRPTGNVIGQFLENVFPK